MNIRNEIVLLEKIQKELTPITTDDEITNAYKLGAFALIVNAIKHLWELKHENYKRI